MRFYSGLSSAGLSAGGAAGAEAGQKGLEFFAALNKAGNFVPVIGKSGTDVLVLEPGDGCDLWQ